MEVEEIGRNMQCILCRMGWIWRIGHHSCSSTLFSVQCNKMVTCFRRLYACCAVPGDVEVLWVVYRDLHEIYIDRCGIGK